MNVFNYSDYKAYLAEKIEKHRGKKGYQAQLARVAGCQPSFLSKALRSHVHLTLDQGAQLCDLWQFSADETDYYLDLMNLARASSPSLKRRIKQRLKGLRDRNENRVLPSTAESSQPEMIYYTTWYYAAIYATLHLPGRNSASAIARYLELPTDLVITSLGTLRTIGLVKSRDNRWWPTKKVIHLPKGSSMTAINQLTWRQHAIAKLQTEPDAGIHYSAVFALSKDDAEDIKLRLWQQIDRVHKIVEPSNEEEVVALNLDFFPL